MNIKALWASLKAKVVGSMVDDWKQGWSWLSMQFATLIVIWPALPEETQATVVAFLASIFGVNISVPAVLAVGVIVGRFVKQRRTQ